MFVSSNRKIIRAIISTLLALVTCAGLSELTPARAVTTTVGVFSPITFSISQKTYTITPPSTNSPGSWSYTSSNTAVATISGNVITALSIGNIQLTATVAASGEYASVTRLTTVSITPGAPPLGTFPNQTLTLGPTPLTLVPPTSPSNGSWTFTSSDPKVANVVGNKVYANDAGTTTITANQTPLGSYLSASTTMTLTVKGVAPTLGTFSSVTISKDSIGSIVLTAPTSNSPGTWSYSSSDASVATVNGNVLNLVSPGKSTITAKQTASGIYQSTSTNMTLTVVGSQTATTTPTTPTSPTTPTTTTPTTSTTTSTNATSSTTPATNSTSTTTSTTPTTQTPTTPKLFTDLLIYFGTIAPDIKLPKTTSTGQWTFISSNPQIVSLNGVTIEPKALGKVTITATQAATPSTPQVQSTFNIDVLPPKNSGTDSTTIAPVVTVKKPVAKKPVIKKPAVKKKVAKKKATKKLYAIKKNVNSKKSTKKNATTNKKQ